MAVKKNQKIAALGTAMVALSAIPATHLDAAPITATVDIQAIVVTSAILVAQTQSLNFGTFTTGGAGGTVAVNTAGVATYTGVVSTPSTVPTEAVVMVKGKNHPAITVSVTNPTVNVSNGTDTMVVNQFNVITNAGGPVNTRPMTAPSVFVPIGATLTVGPGQGTGTYAGTFTVQVQYQ